MFGSKKKKKEEEMIPVEFELETMHGDLTKPFQKKHIGIKLASSQEKKEEQSKDEKEVAEKKVLEDKDPSPFLTDKVTSLHSIYDEDSLAEKKNADFPGAITKKMSSLDDTREIEKQNKEKLGSQKKVTKDGSRVNVPLLVVAVILLIMTVGAGIYYYAFVLGRDVFFIETVVCGNGEKHETEECDDGNNFNGDGCSAFCMTEAIVESPVVASPSIVCGNAIVEEGEECDDGNGLNGDGCNNDCMTEEERDILEEALVFEVPLETVGFNSMLKEFLESLKENEQYKNQLDEGIFIKPVAIQIPSSEEVESDRNENEEEGVAEKEEDGRLDDEEKTSESSGVVIVRGDKTEEIGEIRARLGSAEFLKMIGADLPGIEKYTNGKIWLFVVNERKSSLDDSRVMKLSLLITIKSDKDRDEAMELTKSIENSFPKQLTVLFVDEETPIAPEGVTFSQSELGSGGRYYNYVSGKTNQSIDWNIISYKESSYLMITTSMHSTTQLMNQLELN